MSRTTRTGGSRGGTDQEGGGGGGTPAERAYRLCLPDLRHWAGAYVFVLGDRVVGIFGDEAVARQVATQATDPDLEVLIRRIEH